VETNHTCGSCSSAISDCSFCYTSSSTVYCTSCASGFYTNTNTSCDTCSNGQTNCSNCDSRGAGSLWCFDCISTHYISNYTTGACSLCDVGITNCQTCKEDSTLPNNISCYACATGYYANTTQTECILCTAITNCIECSEIYSASTVVSGVNCTNCTSPYYSLSDGTCATCDNSTYNCAACEEDGAGSFHCSSCNADYWLNSTTKKCEGCTAPCQTCTSPTVCLTCINSSYYVHANGSCVLCTTYDSAWLTCQWQGGIVGSTLEALSCDTYFFLDGTTCTNCTLQNSTYLTCSAANNPLSCMGGYYYMGNNTPPTC